ncbi:MAG TPA: TonB-dependent receptor [Rhizomicrobium sp.]|jgi:outer membrane receptor protein involved in Fe transport
MRNFRTGKIRAHLVTSVGLFALTAGAAFAQDAPAQQPAADSAETVIVSASRISIAGYTAPTPVSVIDSGQLQQAANADIGQTLRQLPMMGTGQSPTNGTQGNAGNSGAVGISSINLRNLGVTRTLVLVDGERQVWAGTQYGVDLNTIPNSLIQRVDVVTGGASAAWGSDAVAGVVNLIINKNFTGFKASVDLQDTGQNLRGQYGFTVTHGVDFLGDRAHVEWAVNYTHSPDTAYMAQLPWFNNPAQVANPAYNAVTNPNVPKNIIVQGAGNSTTPGGIINGGVTNAGAASTALNGIQFGPGGAISNFVAPNCNFYANANLPPYQAAATSKSNTGCYGGSTNQSLSPSQIGLATYPLLTETGFFYGSYKLTSDIQAGLMLQYSKVRAKGSSLTIQQNAVIQRDNAFLPPSLLAQMQTANLKTFTVTSVGTASTQGGFIQPTPGESMEQFANSVGTPVEITNRQLYRGAFSLNGALGNDWSWNADIQHSETHLHERYTSIEITQNYANAIDSVFAPAGNALGVPANTIVCRSSLTSPSNGCVPLNPFGLNQITPQAVNYIVDHDDYYFLNMQQDTAGASMQGILPWDVTGAGAPSTAFGVEYRKETMVSTADPLGAQGALGGGNFIPVRGEYNIIEGFGELNIPILKNGFVDSIDGNMAGRITDYSTSGMVETWKLGLTSQINEDIRMRGTLSFDIRAPNLAELFNVIPASGGQVDYLTGNTAAAALSMAAGNTSLQPEKAITWSAGIVLTPHWIPGLSLSFDWYNINVKNIIVSPSTTFERTACLAGSPTPDGIASVKGTNYNGGLGNPNSGTGYCANWRYNPTNPALATASNPNGLQYLYTFPYNNGFLMTSGLDFNADYQMDLFSGKLGLHLAGNYTDEETETLFGVTDPATGSQATYDFAGSLSNGSLFAGVPKLHFNLSATYDEGPWSGTVQTRYLSSAHLVNGWTSGVQVDNNDVPQIAYLDLRASYKWNDEIQFYGAVDNALGTPPPSTVSYSPSNNAYTTTNPSIYDVLGRMWHAGIRFTY